MKCVFGFAVAAAIALTSPVAAQLAPSPSKSSRVWVDAVVGGETLKLPLAEGFCNFDAKHPTDAAMIARMHRLMVPNATSRFYLMSADCKEMEQWRAGRALLDNYAQYFIDPRFETNKLSIPPEKFVADFCRGLKSAVPKNLKSLVTDQIAEAKDRLRFSKVEMIGVFDEDKTSCNGVAFQEMNTDLGTTKHQIAIDSVMPINGRVFYQMRFSLAGDEKAMRTLIDEQRRLAAVAVEANKK